MHSALVAMGIGPGDEVITSVWTFCATANVIEHVGAKPVPVDVDSDTLNLCPNEVEKAITSSTRAIIPVHFAGHPAPLNELNSIAETHGLKILEDAAHGLGAHYEGTPIGGGQHPAAFSFYATKNLTTGEGGMLTGPDELIEATRVLTLHGMSREAWSRYSNSGSWRYDVASPGFKYNMTDVQAALGLVQLDKFDELQSRRHEVAHAYTQAFSDHPAFQTPVTRHGVGHAWHLYVLKLRPGALSIGRDEFFEELRARNIGASVHFIPLHQLSYYQNKYDLKPENFPIATRYADQVISLPMHGGLSRQDVTDVIEAVFSIVNKHQRLHVAA